MIYAHYDMRYLAYAFPYVHATYLERAQDLHDFWGLRNRWSSRTARGPDQTFEFLDKWLQKELDCVRSFH